ncbi:MAG TPA: hypothetical protein VKA18_05015 [Alphaproteobacteria bacterium]|nr:hypothetical protein [Alphaproteobacteria bacterium]
MIEGLAKTGRLSIIGVYPLTDRFFPIGAAMQKNVTANMGNCNHRRYIPHLVNLMESGGFNSMRVTSHVEPMSDVIQAYKEFDRHKPGWIKVILTP